MLPDGHWLAIQAAGVRPITPNIVGNFSKISYNITYEYLHGITKT